MVKDIIEDGVDPRAAGELEKSMFIAHIFIESKEGLLPAIPVLSPSTEQNFQRPLVVTLSPLSGGGRRMACRQPAVLRPHKTRLS